MGAEYDMYMAGLPFNEWGEIDNWSEKVLIEAFGEEEAAKIQRMRTASVLHVETMVFERVDRLSTVTEVRPPTKFVSIAEMHVKPSKVVAFQLLLGKGKAAREKAPDAPPYSVGRVALGNAHTYVMATGFDSFAERDKWPDTLELMGKAYGEEEARQMLKTYLDSIESRRDYIAIFRPDLSRAKPQAATN
jgi:hypothetical protein